jgi:hypothetical protein
MTQHHHHIPQTFEPIIAVLGETGTEKLLAVSRIQNMLEYAMSHPNADCLWIEPYYHRIGSVFRDVVSIAVKDYKEETRKINNTYHQILLVNGSTLYFYAQSSLQYVRGLTLHWVGFSDALYGTKRDEVYQELVRPSQMAMKDSKDLVTVIAEHPLRVENASPYGIR